MFGYENAIFYKLALELCQMIVRQEIKAGDKLPAVRELAKERKVNPNTVQKAYQVLEEREIVFAIERSGKFVTKDKLRLEKLADEILNDEIDNFIKAIELYGFNHEQVLKKLEEKL